MRLPDLHGLRARLIMWSAPPFPTALRWVGERWSVELTVNFTCLYFGASWEALPVGYRDSATLHVRIGVPCVVLHLIRESSYELWQRGLSKACHCCPCCCANPCDGLMQGGVCDLSECVCDCPDERDDDEDNIPF